MHPCLSPSISPRSHEVPVHSARDNLRVRYGAAHGDELVQGKLRRPASFYEFTFTLRERPILASVELHGGANLSWAAEEIRMRLLGAGFEGRDARDCPSRQASGVHGAALPPLM